MSLFFSEDLQLPGHNVQLKKDLLQKLTFKHALKLLCYRIYRYYLNIENFKILLKVLSLILKS